MACRQLHPWNVDCSVAAGIQRRLREQLVLVGDFPANGLVAGVDASYSKRAPTIYAAVAVLKLPELEVVETATAVREATFPYVPGYLSFREAPAILQALDKLRCWPDGLMVDAQGIAHPRRFGLACHIGLLADLPTIGCAKSRLVGEHRQPGRGAGCHARLFLLTDGRREVIGAVVRTREGVGPLYVSQGHRVSLAAAVKAVLACTRGCRLPEPTRHAHHLANVARLAGAG